MPAKNKVTVRKIPQTDFYHSGEYEVKVTNTTQRQALGIFDYPDEKVKSNFFSDKMQACKYANRIKSSKRRR